MSSDLAPRGILLLLKHQDPAPPVPPWELPVMFGPKVNTVLFINVAEASRVGWTGN